MIIIESVMILNSLFLGSLLPEATDLEQSWTTQSDIPSTVREAFSPGSSLYADAVKREVALLQPNGSPQAVTASFSAPRRTNYIQLDPQSQGAITSNELSALPQRYESYQYIDGRARAQYTVDQTGEFTVVEDPDYRVAQKLAAFPTNGFHVTTWPQYDFWIPADGSTVYALNATSEEFLGASSLASDAFRALDAAKILASEAEHRQLLAEEAAFEKAMRSPALVAVGLLVSAVGLAVVFFPRSRKIPA